jgi:DNA repair protein RecO (recombination protein O)
MFAFLLHTIQTLDLNERGTANFHLAFLVHFSRYLGFYPNTEHATDDMWFDVRRGGYVPIPTSYSPLPEYNSLLTKLLGISFDSLDSLELNHHQRNYLTDYLLGYYATHIESFGKLKSFAVLQDVFL